MCPAEALAQIELRAESYENAMGRKAVVAARGSSSSAMLSGYTDVGQQRAEASRPVSTMPVPRVIRASSVRAPPGAGAPSPSRDSYTGAPAPGERSISRVLASSARHSLPAGFAQDGASPHQRGADATGARAHGHLASPSVPASSSDYILPQYLPLQSSAAPAGRASLPPHSAAQPPPAQPPHTSYGAPQRVLRAADVPYPLVPSIIDARASTHAPPQTSHSSPPPAAERVYASPAQRQLAVSAAPPAPPAPPAGAAGGWADASHVPPPISYSAGDKGGAVPRYARPAGAAQGSSYHAAQAEILKSQCFVF